ncbi:hypothetical protein [Lysobacter hankyongensis]|uniref:DUF5648 domain-containing protein n=1 Tax=Lysobacter hankyongensis TaxID=1176535 RepID=A0ABP9AP53_9GAMM
MKTRIGIFALLMVFSTGSIGQITPQPPLVALRSAYNAQYTDHFYTIDAQQHATAVGNHGYANTGILAYMEKTQQPSTRPFKRFFKGAPQLDHFYTASATEESQVLAAGYVYEGIEGYIYTTQVPGSVPMYRAAKYDGATGDLVHKYTLSSTELYNLTTQGWGSDGLQGYVYTTANPTVSGGMILGLRCPGRAAGDCNGTNPNIPNYRDYYFGSTGVAATSKPAGRTTQRMRFRFWSPDYFGSTDHLFFSLHGRFSLGSPNALNVCPSQDQVGPSCTWHRGLGMIIFGQSISMPNNSWPAQMPNQVFTESWWVAGNDGGNLRGANPGSSTLANNRTYSVDIRVSDNGNISYSIIDTGTNTLVKSDIWNASGQFANPASPFPVELTGYTLGYATGSQRDYTVYITNFSVDWL